VPSAKKPCGSDSSHLSAPPHSGQLCSAGIPGERTAAGRVRAVTSFLVRGRKRWRPRSGPPPTTRCIAHRGRSSSTVLRHRLHDG
jgi:hypothetical protein